jgi:hypothetical protein
MTSDVATGQKFRVRWVESCRVYRVLTIVRVRYGERAGVSTIPLRVVQYLLTSSEGSRAGAVIQTRASAADHNRPQVQQ